MIYAPLEPFSYEVMAEVFTVEHSQKFPLCDTVISLRLTQPPTGVRKGVVLPDLVSVITRRQSL